MKKTTNKRPKKPHLSLPCASWIASQGLKPLPFIRETASLIVNKTVSLFMLIIIGFLKLVIKNYIKITAFPHKRISIKYGLMLSIFMVIFSLISIDQSQNKKQEQIEIVIAASEEKNEFGQVSNTIGWESWDEDFIIPVGGYKSQGYRRGHSGIDYAAEIYSPVHPITAGKVVHAGWEAGGYGITVIVDHGHELIARYAHLANTSVKIGQEVKTEDTLGEVGLTGRTTGPHVHVEIYDQSQNINPENFIPLAN